MYKIYIIFIIQEATIKNIIYVIAIKMIKEAKYQINLPAFDILDIIIPSQYIGN